MRRDLAQIGVLGHQLDVAQGGDVNPATGRLLSIAELQQALRAVRRGPAPASAPTGHVAPRNGWQTGLPELADPAPDTTPPEPADLDDLDDLYGWREQDEEKPDAQPASTPHPSPAGRSWRRWTDVALLARRWPPRTATRQGTVAPPRGARARASRPVARHQDPQWLADAEDGSDTAAGDLTTEPVSVGCPGEGDQPLAHTAAQSRAAPTMDDVQVSAAPRGFMTGLWMWVARVAVALVFFAGVNQVFIKPFQRPAVPTSAVINLNISAAQQAAARYVSDYLTYLPGRGAAQLTAVQSDLVPAAGPVAQWSGTGYLRAESVLPGQVVTIDPAHALVSVAAQIQVALPTTTTTTAPAAASSGVDPGPVPTGWRDGGTRWVQLIVPVESNGPAVKVSAGGGVFCGEPPAPVAPAVNAQVDNAVTTSTQAVATSLLTAYASSDVAYLAAPGVSLTGLNSALALVSLTGWSVAVAAGAGTAGTGTGLVTWQLAGTDLRIGQPYAISLTNSQNRWYGAAVGPNISKP